MPWNLDFPPMQITKGNFVEKLRRAGNIERSHIVSRASRAEYGRVDKRKVE